MATDHQYRQAAQALGKSKKTIAVTGAGMSAESNIPTFRDAGGLWEKYPIEEFATIDGYRADPQKVWQFWRELSALFKDCRPNPGHHALADLEAKGHLAAIITQNIDNLHQEAGNTRVIEYHGNARRLACLTCGHEDPLDPNDFPPSPPKCPCGGLMKPAVIMFGERIPTQAIVDSEEALSDCDVCIVIGTSAEVYPAAAIPTAAKNNGAYIIEANIQETAFTTTFTDTFLQGPAGETLPRLLEGMRGHGL
jgi:NAD-dependent deacetylase